MPDVSDDTPVNEEEIPFDESEDDTDAGHPVDGSGSEEGTDGA